MKKQLLMALLASASLCTANAADNTTKNQTSQANPALISTAKTTNSSIGANTASTDNSKASNQAIAGDKTVTTSTTGPQWGLYCKSDAKCNSLFVAEPVGKNSDSQVLFAYNNGMNIGNDNANDDQRTLVLDFTQVPIDELKNNITLTVDKSAPINVPVIASGEKGISAALTNQKSVSMICEAMSKAKNATISFTEQGKSTPTIVNVNLDGFHQHLSQMPKCDDA